MLGKTHLVVTEAVLTVGCLAIPISIVPTLQLSAVIIGGAAGALAPDLDKQNTMAAKRLPHVAKVLSKFGHRTWTHTIWALILLGILPAFLSLLMIQWRYSDHQQIVFFSLLTNIGLLLDGFWLGYLCHLIEDNYSVQGVMFLYPFTHYAISQNTGHPYKPRPWSNFRYHTGSATEDLIRHIAWLVFIVSLYFFIRHGLETQYLIDPIKRTII